MKDLPLDTDTEEWNIMGTDMLQISKCKCFYPSYTLKCSIFAKKIRQFEFFWK